MEPKRVNHTGPRNARLDAGTVNCGKSTNTMHNTDLLEDLVGMIGLGGDNDEVMELGSNYQYGEDLRSPKYNTAADQQNHRYGAKLNGRGRKQAPKEAAWRDLTRNSNGVVRPGSSTNATLRDFRSRTDARAKRRSLRSQDMNDHELELNSLDRDSNEGDVYHLDFDGTMRRRDGVREAADDPDRSRLQMGTEEDNSQIKLIPKDVRGSDSNLRASDIHSRDSADIEMENFDERASLCRPADITQTELIQILEQTLYQYYLIDSKKFNVRKLLKKVDPDLVKRLEARIKFKVNKENRSLNKIFIDFGPYPLIKAWQIKKKEKEQIENQILGAKDNNEDAAEHSVQRNLKKALIENQNKQTLFIAPDEDNYSQHGIKNLVVKYQEFASTLELDDVTHKESVFYRVNMLEGVLEDFVNRLNEHLEPLKDQAQDIDRFSFMFLMIGFFATLLIDLITAYLLTPWISVAVSAFYVVILAIVFYRNNRQLRFTHQTIILKMAIMVYLENHSVFLHRGVRAQLGYMGQWIEFRKERRRDDDQIANGSINPNLTFKRTLKGLQNGGVYGINGMHQTMNPPQSVHGRGDSISMYSRTNMNPSQTQQQNNSQMGNAFGRRNGSISANENRSQYSKHYNINQNFDIRSKKSSIQGSDFNVSPMNMNRKNQRHMLK